MNARTTVAIVGAAMAYSSVASALTPDGWEYMTTDSGVAVYKKHVEGSDIVAFRGVTYTDIHIGKLVAVFENPEQRPHWLDRYASHSTFESTKWTEVYWIHFGLPWPVADRDYVLEAKAKPMPDKRKLVVNIKSVERADKPKDDCCVRAELYGTYYEFVALPGEERTKIVVEVHTDPKGSIPTWLVNLIQKSWPAKTLHGLIERTKEVDPPPFPDLVDWHRPKSMSVETSTTTGL